MTSIITSDKTEPELLGPWTISHRTQTPVARPEHTFDFAKPTDLIREIDYFYYFHDPILTWDPTVVAAIKEFDPTVIPCFVKKVFLWPTGGEAVLTYFAILRERYPTTNLKEPFKLRRCSCPEHIYLWPNVEEVVFGGEAPAPGWPDSFIPCDARMAQRLKRIFWMTARDPKDIAKDLVDGEAARQAAGEAALQSQFNDRFDDEWGHMKRTINNLSQRDVETMHLMERPTRPSVHVRMQDPPAAPTAPASPVQGA